ncbi:glycosyltransferase family 4 protein [Helicobacter suis]|uniref:glycosyltransferase family 4 protein n=1 Tax=Helicobacter suis TaxID=104628 RepID=UPI00249052BA|nr:undecaprenyl/decaprenyl-phosphate alpha-N-acetylglucosaminyl 1-phosphate transferase [Helicobacter suis]
MWYIAVSFLSGLIIVLISKYSSLFVDNANKPQGFHTKKTPRAGGLGIFLAFLGVGFKLPLLKLLGLSFVFLSGFLEDLSMSLSPKKRLLLQALGVICVIYTDHLVITHFTPFFNLPFVLALPFSVFMLVGISNAINIIDGFNGLAGGLNAMILAILYMIEPSQTLLALLLGVLGFLVLNFPKGYIFLGDGGAYFLGLMCGVHLMDLALRGVVSVWFGLALMIYPVTEVLFSIARRKYKRKKATLPDALHLHTLIFKSLSLKTTLLNSNALTGLVVVGLNLPFMLISFIFRHQPLLLLSLIGVFVCAYLFFYQWLLNYHKEHPCV